MNRWRTAVRERGCLRVGHRGAAGLEPQNTLRAFRRAIDLGVDAVELDVQWTRDHHLVVLHDAELEKSTNGHGFVGDYTLAEIRQLDAGRGERVPTVDEVLELVKGKALVVVDLKMVGYEEQVADALLRHGMRDDAIVCSLEPENLRRVRAAAPGILTALSYPEDKGNASTKAYLKPIVDIVVMLMRLTMPLRIATMIAAAGAEATMLYYKVISPALVQTVHKHGWLVGAWTVDRVENMARLRAMGVDSITSNHPDLLASA